MLKVLPIVTFTLLLAAFVALGYDSKARAQAESLMNIPVGACFEGGKCWDGAKWIERPSGYFTPTRTWQVWAPELGTSVTLWVTDTTGTCVYSEFYNGNLAVTAVPKTSLKPGVGCQ